MCGIAGYLSKKVGQRPATTIQQLIDPIRQRGPDDEGLCLIARNENAWKPLCTERTVPSIASTMEHYQSQVSQFDHDITLIHTRYSIIDLSTGGHQPFVSHDGNVIAVFNGEIYNYVELRAELEAAGHKFRTSSDTEVLVEGYRAWKEDLWSKMNGFWAVVIYDRRSRCLLLSRDRIGVAPLYWRDTADAFYFASSIQSLVDIDPAGVSLNKDVAAGFIDTSIKDSDNTTFYEQIHSLPAASVTHFAADACCQRDAETTVFWRLPQRRWKTNDLPLTEAVDTFRETFVNAVEIRLRADVNVSFELSGGLDSASVVAVAATLRNNDLTTYTIKVPDQNEEPYARSILKRYPVDYRVLSEPEDDFLPAIHEFSRLMQEPFHSPNIFSHYWMRCQMKTEGVSAVLSGVGGDEALAGYESVFWRKAVEEMRSEGQSREASAYEMARRYGSLGRALKTLRTKTQRLNRKAKRAARRVARYGAAPFSALRRQPLNGSPSPANFSHDEQSQGLSRAWNLSHRYRAMPYGDQRCYHFQVGLLPYYLRSNDHFTMSIPLEHRFPLLDYRVVELGMQLPAAYLFKNGWTKYILRKAMEPWLPPEILWRRTKMGFPFPLSRFLTQHQHRLEPLFEEVRAVNLNTLPLKNYPTMLREGEFPRLWRICSTGCWLQSTQRVCM